MWVVVEGFLGSCGWFLVVLGGCGWWVLVGGCILSCDQFTKISQHLQENTCARVSFLIKLQASGLKPATLLKKRLRRKRFLVNFAKFLRKNLFYRTPLGDCFCSSWPIAKILTILILQFGQKYLNIHNSLYFLPNIFLLFCF